MGSSPPTRAGSARSTTVLTTTLTTVTAPTTVTSPTTATTKQPVQGLRVFLAVWGSDVEKGDVRAVRQTASSNASSAVS
jgi:hypothetical protein